MKTILILLCVSVTGCIGNTLGSFQTGPGSYASTTQSVKQDIQAGIVQPKSTSAEVVAPTSIIPRERLDNGRCSPYVPFDDFIKCDLVQAQRDVEQAAR